MSCKQGEEIAEIHGMLGVIFMVDYGCIISDRVRLKANLSDFDEILGSANH